MAGRDGRFPRIKTSVSKADILREECDAIVVAIKANTYSLHGNLAAAAFEAAGPESSTAIAQHLRMRKLCLNEVEQFEAGELPSKYIIVVGLSHLSFCLQEAVYHVLVRAHELQCRSIALPVLGCGGFGYRAADCAESMLSAVEAFKSGYGAKTLLRDIRIVAQNSEHKSALDNASRRT